MSDSTFSRRFTYWNSGAIAGTLSAIILQPFDVLKTYSIVVKRSESSLLEGYKLAYSKFGIRGMWRGVTPAVYRAIAGSGSYFLLLEEFKYISGATNIWALGLCSGMAKVAVTVACMPISVVKVRMESPTCTVYTGVHNGLKSIYKTEGIPGLYRGLLPTVVREVPYSSLGYGFYEKYIQILKQYTGRDRTDPIVTFISGSLAGFSATLITQPFDVMKTRIIYQRVSGGDCTSMRKAIASIYKEDGILGFQRGIIARLCRRFFSFPLVWTVYEQIKITI